MIHFKDASDANLADRCIRPLCFAGPGDEYYGLEMVEITREFGERRRVFQLGLQGSAVLLRYRQLFFVLFTRHQIAMIPGETLEEFSERMNFLFVLMDDGHDSRNVPIRQMLFDAEGELDDDYNDFIIGVVEESMLDAYSRDQFFPVSDNVTGRKDDLALAAGFPSHRQRVLMQTDGLVLQAVCKTGSIEQRETGSGGVFRYSEDGEPLDGMSGGAIFIPRLESRNPVRYSMFLDGLIQRGGNGYVRYLPIERILGHIRARLQI